jgi:uncharacterized protein YndB with AHSA1/START domain
MTEEKGTGAPVVRLTRRLKATPEEVFDAWLDPESLKQWMRPGDITVPIAEVDARVGGRYRIVMRGSEADYDHEGEYREIDRPHRLAFTWISPATGGKPSLVTVELTPQGDETELVLTHAMLPNEDIAGKHRMGWTAALEELADHVATVG